MMANKTWRGRSVKRVVRTNSNSDHRWHSTDTDVSDHADGLTYVATPARQGRGRRLMAWLNFPRRLAEFVSGIVSAVGMGR